MTIRTFKLQPGLNTHQINNAIRLATDIALQEFTDARQAGVVGNHRLDRRKGERRHIFGIGTSLRDTLVAHYVVGSGEVGICFPANYQGWERADSYTRLRVRIYDLIVHHRHDIVDTSVPCRES